MTRAAEALINLQALSHNYQRVRHCAPDSRIVAVIKANGYGHGLVRVARLLDEADAFAVASLDEAVTLRQAGIRQAVVLLSGVCDEAELDLACEHDLSLVVHHDYQLALLENMTSGTPRPVWLKIDTGMHRLGFRPERAAECFARLRDCRAAVRSVILMTHLANADVPGDDMTSRQTELFYSAVAGLDADHSIANSAGILAWPQTHFHDHPSWVRPGIMLYGVSPIQESTAVDHDLRPVMTLRAQLIAVNQCRKGDAIGYGGSWECPEDMPVGVVAIGYGDGYPRHAKSGTPVLVDGRRVSLIGRVSMDMITVDLRHHARAKPGAEVILWGDGLPAEEVARDAGTIGYELLCRVTARVNQVVT